MVDKNETTSPFVVHEFNVNPHLRHQQIPLRFFLRDLACEAVVSCKHVVRDTF